MHTSDLVYQGAWRCAVQLNRWNYYGDFVVYPVFVVLLAVLALGVPPGAEWWRYGLLFCTGVIAWTFAEYGLHRFVFHRTPRIRDLHEAHHRDPHALIGMPTFTSAPAYLILLLFPLWWIGGLAFACSLTAGFLFGHLWYVTVHHLVHHRGARQGSLLTTLKRRHALHHHVSPGGQLRRYVRLLGPGVGEQYPAAPQSGTFSGKRPSSRRGERPGWAVCRSTRAPRSPVAHRVPKPVGILDG
jgi:sterol desaturase/sphingolipid hydroxylase (fatty acid hydroxylase superfamily)